MIKRGLAKGALSLPHSECLIFFRGENREKYEQVFGLYAWSQSKELL